jgi:hypothetical protein
MKDKKEQDTNSKKIAGFLVALFSGFIEKISVSLILNARKQIKEIISQLKKGVFAGLFLLTGLFLLVIGLAVYVNSIFSFIPGGGYFVIGGLSLLIAFIIMLFIKK